MVSKLNSIFFAGLPEYLRTSGASKDDLIDLTIGGPTSDAAKLKKFYTAVYDQFGLSGEQDVLVQQETASLIIDAFDRLDNARGVQDSKINIKAFLDVNNDRQIALRDKFIFYLQDGFNAFEKQSIFDMFGAPDNTKSIQDITNAVKGYVDRIIKDLSLSTLR